MSIKLRTCVSLLLIAAAVPIAAAAGIPIVELSSTETIVGSDIDKAAGQDGRLNGKDCNFHVSTRAEEDDSWLGKILSRETIFLDVNTATCGSEIIQLSGISYEMKMPLKKGDAVTVDWGFINRVGRAVMQIEESRALGYQQ